MSKLNRDEIIKALECCSIKHGTCHECIYQRMPTLTNCIVFNMQNAFALIKELTKENERLRVEEKQSQTLIKTLHDKLDEGYAKFVDEERANTVREMRERLNEKLFTVPTVYNSHFGRMVDQIAKDLLEKCD